MAEGLPDLARRLLVSQLADDGIEGVAELRAQLPLATIRSSCECGCGSVGFEFDNRSDAVRSTAASPYPVEGEILGEDGSVTGGLLLFLKDGLLHDLDVYSYGDPLPLPDPARVLWSTRLRPNDRILTAIAGPEVDDLARRLRAEGWAAHVTVESLVRTWEHVAADVGSYEATVDDYTNDVTARDALTKVLAWAHAPVRDEIERRTTLADRQFRAATVDDGGAAIGRYYRIDRKDGWWWRRRPTTGRLAAYLDG